MGEGERRVRAVSCSRSGESSAGLARSMDTLNNLSKISQPGQNILSYLRSP